MHKIRQLLQTKRNLWGKHPIQIFDPEAEVFLFGSGTQHHEMPIDIHIKVTKSRFTHEMTKKELLKFKLNVD